MNFLFLQNFQSQCIMYTLLSGLYRHLTQKDEYFILILGLDNAGWSVVPQMLIVDQCSVQLRQLMFQAKPHS